MNDHIESIIGTIDRIIFTSSDTGFTVFTLIIGRNQLITAKATASHLVSGQDVQLRGAWVNHPKFGKQFDAQECTPCLPTSEIGLRKYLSSGLIKGIGASYANKLVDYFGTKVLDVIEKEPEQLKNVPGIGEKRVESIVAAWKDQKEVAQVMVFLQEKGISPAYATKMYKRYKDQTIAIVSENPYRLCEDIWGIGFKKADECAQKLGFSILSPFRLASGILFGLTQASQQGHLYVELNQLRKNVIALLEIQEDEATPLLKKSFQELYQQEKIYIHTNDSKHYITTPSCMGAEKGTAERLKRLMNYSSKITFDLDDAYKKMRTPQEGSIALNEQQQQGVLSCLQHKVSIITGGPGTGKTTLIKQLLSILDDHNVRYKLAAPTGRAAKRIIEGTQRYAMTVHRLLEFDPAIMRFSHNEYNALALDFLIIDESSMIDVFLAHAIIKAIPLTAHVVFIGDVDQLPSVGAGNFLSDCISSGAIPTTRLNYIFRQAQDSLITLNAHRVNNGEFPLRAAENAKRDFIFIKEELPENVITHLRTIFFSELKKHAISIHDARVLTPMNRGGAGTIALNSQLQTLLNTNTQPGIMHTGVLFKCNDLVMQIRNNYDKHVYNGDTGNIIALSTAEKTITVQFGEKEVIYESDEFNEIVLAYATTIHKSQGSEYAAAIIPLFVQHFTLLQRNLVYTAITRAKRLCIIIGQPKALAMALNNTKGTERTTFLHQFLKEST